MNSRKRLHPRSQAKSGALGMAAAIKRSAQVDKEASDNWRAALHLPSRGVKKTAIVGFSQSKTVAVVGDK